MLFFIYKSIAWLQHICMLSTYQIIRKIFIEHLKPTTPKAKKKYNLLNRKLGKNLDYAPNYFFPQYLQSADILVVNSSLEKPQGFFFCWRKTRWSNTSVGKRSLG